MVTGAFAGPKVGESPMGTSVLVCSAWAVTTSSRKKIQLSSRLIMADRKGDTGVSPFSL